MEVKKLTNKEVPTIKPKELAALKVKLTKIDWDDLAYNLIVLESEYVKVKKYLKLNQDQSFRKLIRAYESEKYRRIQEIEKNNEQSFYGPAEGSPAWLEDESFLE